jgi:NAD(P)-dependent dehydrogenase (short-subunit alcohol dehydrogenase family)
MTQSLFDLTGKNAIVTGASSGLGRHFALTLAKAGARVAIAARRIEKLKGLAEEIANHGGRAIPIELDVTDQDSIKAAIAHAETELGAITILVNNAGTVAGGPTLKHSEEDWDKVIDTNLKGAFFIAQETAQHMSKHGHGGSIINIGSILGLRGSGGVPSYAASKGGITTLTPAMAADLARHGIRVNAIAPGYVETDLNRDFLNSKVGEEMKNAKIAMKRFGAPGDLDGALLLLASDASAYMTGSIITVDGGQSSII